MTPRSPETRRCPEAAHSPPEGLQYWIAAPLSGSTAALSGLPGGSCGASNFRSRLASWLLVCVEARDDLLVALGLDAPALERPLQESDPVPELLDQFLNQRITVYL